MYCTGCGRKMLHTQFTREFTRDGKPILYDRYHCPMVEHWLKGTPEGRRYWGHDVVDQLSTE